LARITLKYANVYFAARLFNSLSSSGVKIILYGLLFGIDNLLFGYQHATYEIKYQAKNTLAYLLKYVLSDPLLLPRVLNGF